MKKSLELWIVTLSIAALPVSPVAAQSPAPPVMTQYPFPPGFQLEADGFVDDNRPRIATWANASDAYFSWTDFNGACWVTPVRNQGSCGSCFTFGAIAAAESMYRIVRNQPDFALDLSEQEIISCGLSDSCSTGGTAEQVGYYLKADGVVDESCFPYTSGIAGDEGQCTDSCDDGLARRYWITDWHMSTVPLRADALKEALLAGPIIANMQIYDDFYGYTGGVYQRSSDVKSGWHIVLLVGWDDSDESWLAKNSWGQDWGMGGYVKLHYDERNCFPDSLSDLSSFSGTCFASHTTTFSLSQDDAFGPGESRDGGGYDTAPSPDAALPDQGHSPDSQVLFDAVIPDRARATDAGIAADVTLSDQPSADLGDSHDSSTSDHAADDAGLVAKNDDDTTVQDPGCNCAGTAARQQSLWSALLLLGWMWWRKFCPQKKPSKDGF